MNVLISGATGAMGNVVADLITESASHTIVAGFADQASSEGAFPIYDSLNDVTEEVDVVIDFSDPASLEALLAYGTENKVPLVLATTGYSEEQEAQIEEASKKVAILHAKNMSLGVNIMEIVAGQLAKALGQFDIEIIEKHHRYKKDSPSGTARMLYDAVNRGRNESLRPEEGRSGFYDERPVDEVGISAVRGGTIVGEHSVIFAGEDEVVEIKHEAHSKKIFANGALQAAEFVSGQSNGLYNMDDVLSEA